MKGKIIYRVLKDALNKYLLNLDKMNNFLGKRKEAKLLEYKIFLKNLCRPIT